jgi:hypothetical protein
VRSAARATAYGAPVVTPKTVGFTTLDNHLVHLSPTALRPLSVARLGVPQIDNRAPFGYTYGFGQL